MIHFEKERLDRVKEAYEDWWEGASDSLLSGAVVIEHDPGRDCPPVPLLTQATCADFSYTPEQVIDRIDYELSKRGYYGDAFPFFSLDCMGPGVVSAFCGARPDNSSGTMWFFPEKELPLEEMHFRFDPENPYFKRVAELLKAGIDRWGDMVILGLPDLGGAVDILATFRTTENLLFDLYDNPDEVKRLIAEISDVWFQYYQALYSIDGMRERGYCDWSGIWSAKPSYILQCDFSYMIGSEMFREFALEELRQTSAKLSRCFFHLDGPGEIKHVDDLLSIKTLNGIQWIPGSGNGTPADYPELYKKIADAGKKVQIRHAGYDQLAVLRRAIGNDAAIHHATMIYEQQDKDWVLSNLKALGKV